MTIPAPEIITFKMFTYTVSRASSFSFAPLKSSSTTNRGVRPLWFSSSSLALLLVLAVGAWAANPSSSCSKVLSCQACVDAPGCGWCAGSCTPSTECPLDIRLQTRPEECGEPFKNCANHQRCTECVTSPASCKFCPGSVGCVPASSIEVCPTDYLDQREECAEEGFGVGSRLAPFACLIVLLAFLVVLQ